MLPKSGLLAPKGLPAYREFLRSAIVSSLSFGLDFLTCMLIVERTGMGYLGATAISFTAGTLMNYLLSVIWVFGRGRIESWHLELLAFLGIAAIGLLLNDAAMYLFTGRLGIHYLVSRVMSATSVFFFNFAARKYLLFADHGRGPAALLRRLHARAVMAGRARRLTRPGHGQRGGSMRP
jgi:putative flippase GtrA